MPTTYKGAILPTDHGDADTWGAKLNTALQVFDDNLGRIVTVPITNVNVALDADESKAVILRLTGTLTGAVQVTTSCAGFTFVENATSGAFAVTFTNGVGTPVTITQGDRVAVITDATNGARLAFPRAASETVAGIVELATTAETAAGVSTTTAVTPAAAAATFNVGILGIIQDQKVSGTNGGTFTSGSWQTRVLNTEVYDRNSILSVSGNQFTISTAGTYEISWSAPAVGVNNHKTRLYNVSGSAVAGYGSTEFSQEVDVFDPVVVSTTSYGIALVTIVGSTTFRIEHKCDTTYSSDGFGVASNFDTEIYTSVIIRQG